MPHRTTIIKIFGAILSFFLVELLLIQLSSFRLTENAHLPVDSSQYQIRDIKIPQEATFAGEGVPIHEQDVQERLDRELTVNTYWHSHTILHIKRANRWFPVIKTILKEENVPEDFKYMAVAESSLDNKAVSPDGAKGMWQLMEGSAKDLGLEVNDNVDERLNVEKATQAACRYLKKAHDTFGSWTLAAASYNVGIRALKEELESQTVNNYYDLYLNTETGRFIYRILAIKTILQNPQKFGFHLAPESLYPPYQVQTLKVDTSISNIARFAHRHHTTYKRLKILNPWLLEAELHNENGTTYRLQIPAREK